MHRKRWISSSPRLKLRHFLPNCAMAYPARHRVPRDELRDSSQTNWHNPSATHPEARPHP